jgi:plasmid stabilization system protein ParE
MAKIIWSPQSLDDLESIATYIAKEAPYYAGSLIESILDAVENLAAFP